MLQMGFVWVKMVSTDKFSEAAKADVLFNFDFFFYLSAEKQIDHEAANPVCPLALHLHVRESCSR